MDRDNSDILKLIRLVNYRWSIPLIADLFSAKGSKVVTLCSRLGVGRESLLRSLAKLSEQGLVKRNPGYGHPMRPEYILTAAGRAIGNASEQLVIAARTQKIETLAFQKWSFPVVHSLGIGATRFRGIQTQLPSITSRALSLSLKDLAQASIVNRSVREEYPPISTYELTPAGTHLATLVTDLSASML